MLNFVLLAAQVNSNWPVF